MIGMFVLLFHALIMGVAVFCMMSRISAWVWASLLFLIYMAGTFFIFIRGDRIIVADQRKDDLVALPKDA